MFVEILDCAGRSQLVNTSAILGVLDYGFENERTILIGVYDSSMGMNRLCVPEGEAERLLPYLGLEI